MDNGRYNGWANYATWRVMTEHFDGWLDSKEDGEIREIAAITTQVERNKYAESRGIDKKWHQHVTDAIEFCDRLKDEVEEMIEYAIAHSEIVKGWAFSFLNEVNWVEIADRIITDARDRLED